MPTEINRSKKLIILALISILTVLILGYLLLQLYNVFPGIAQTFVNSLAGILVGLVFLIASFPIQSMSTSIWSLSRYTRRFLNRLSFLQVLLGGLLFFLIAMIGTTSVFGINLTDNIYVITFIGAGFGLYMGMGVNVDYGLIHASPISYWIAVFSGVFFVFFGIILSAVMGTTFIGVAVLTRLIGSLVIYKFLRRDLYLPLSVCVAVVNIIALPFLAYLSGLPGG